MSQPGTPPPQVLGGGGISPLFPSAPWDPAPRAAGTEGDGPGGSCPVSLVSLPDVAPKKVTVSPEKGRSHSRQRHSQELCAHHTHTNTHPVHRMYTHYVHTTRTHPCAHTIVTRCTGAQHIHTIVTTTHMQTPWAHNTHQTHAHTRTHIMHITYTCEHIHIPIDTHMYNIYIICNVCTCSHAGTT